MACHAPTTLASMQNVDRKSRITFHHLLLPTVLGVLLPVYTKHCTIEQSHSSSRSSRREEVQALSCPLLFQSSLALQPSKVVTRRLVQASMMVHCTVSFIKKSLFCKLVFVLTLIFLSNQRHPFFLKMTKYYFYKAYVLPTRTVFLFRSSSMLPSTPDAL